MLTSKRSYFIKAWYEWMTDNRLTPHIIVNAQYSGVRVPREYVENDRITLNISPQAIHAFNPKPHAWEFEADFDAPIGLVSIFVPVEAILAIYAEENKQGAFFVEEEKETSKEFASSEELSEKGLPAFTVVEE